MTIIDTEEKESWVPSKTSICFLIYGISSYIALKLNEISLGFEHYIMRRHKHYLKES